MTNQSVRDSEDIKNAKSKVPNFIKSMDMSNDTQMPKSKDGRNQNLNDRYNQNKTPIEFESNVERQS